MAEQTLSVEYRSRDGVWWEADPVRLHVAHSDEGEGLIDEREFSMMKPSAFLINTSRGGVVDEDALFEALARGIIAGAGLDVFREEPLSATSLLLKLDNVILTPHIGGGTREPNLLKEIRDVLTNVARIAKGEEPQNLLNAGKTL